MRQSASQGALPLVMIYCIRDEPSGKSVADERERLKLELELILCHLTTEM